MVNFEKTPQDKLNDESTFYDPEEGVEYEYVEEEEVSGDGVEYEYVEEEEVPEDGVEYEYVEEEEVPEDGVEYEYVEEEEVPEDGVEYEYVEEEVPEDGVEYEYVEEEVSEDGVEYEYVDGEELPDGMASDGEAYAADGLAEEAERAGLDDEAFGDMSGDGEDSEDGKDAEDGETGEEGEKPRSFFGRLTEATPYEVMIGLAFLFIMIGILLMLMEWMRYEMISYPNYTK